SRQHRRKNGNTWSGWLCGKRRKSSIPHVQQNRWRNRIHGRERNKRKRRKTGIFSDTEKRKGEDCVVRIRNLVIEVIRGIEGFFYFLNSPNYLSNLITQFLIT